MKNIFKKYLSLLLAVVMLVSLFPVSAYAVEGEEIIPEELPAEVQEETVPEEVLSEQPEESAPAEEQPASEEPVETEAPVVEEPLPEVEEEPEVTGPVWEQVFTLDAVSAGSECSVELPGTAGEVSAEELADASVLGLPAELTLTQKVEQNPADNVYVLSGTPAAAGSVSFLLQVTAGGGDPRLPLRPHRDPGRRETGRGN